MNYGSWVLDTNVVQTKSDIEALLTGNITSHSHSKYIEEGAWQSISLSGAGSARYRKVGNHVYLEMYDTLYKGSTGVLFMGTIPVGYRPNKFMGFSVRGYLSVAIAHFSIATDGTINFEKMSTYSGTETSMSSPRDWYVQIDYFTD